jgi:hypothetical protein
MLASPTILARWKSTPEMADFPPPRVLYQDETGWDLRAPVQGAVDPFGLYERIVGDSAFAYVFGEDLIEHR